MSDYVERPQIPMVCGSCSGKLISDNGAYTHEGPMLDRHGSWPVEPWDDEAALLEVRWERWRPPSWDYPPLPGVEVNPVPPEPPVGTKLAMRHRPDEVLFYRAPGGWRMPEWDDEPFGRLRFEPWFVVRSNFGPLVVVP